MLVKTGRLGGVMLTNRKVILIGLALLMLAAGALLYLDSQQKYTGGYKNGKYHGAGVIEYRNGDRFEGYFQEGKANGFGRYILSNGDVLEGMWEEQNYVGPGKYTFSDGESYEIKRDDEQLLDELSKVEI